jgi:hypothetical protein
MEMILDKIVSYTIRKSKTVELLIPYVLQPIINSDCSWLKLTPLYELVASGTYANIENTALPA